MHVNRNIAGESRKRRRSSAVRLQIQHLTRGLDQQARLFHDLRRNVPSSPRAVGWNLNRMKNPIVRSRISKNEKRNLLRTIQRTEETIPRLQEIKKALRNGDTTSKELLASFISQYKQMDIDRFLDFAHKIVTSPSEVRVKIDWIGVHFFVTPMLAKELYLVDQTDEGEFSGRSFPDTEIPTYGRVPFSVTVDLNPRSFETEQHEKWHDFERLNAKLKPSSFPNEKELRYPVVVMRIIENWFRNELSASVYGTGSISANTDMYWRIQAYFQKLRDRRQEMPNREKIWTPAALRRLNGLRDQMIGLAHDVSDIWGDVEMGVGVRGGFSNYNYRELPENDILRKKITDGRPLTRQYTRLLLAGLISTTPLHQLKKKLRQFARSNQKIRKRLPYRRHARIGEEE